MAADRYETPDDEVELERVRLAMLAECRDPDTFTALTAAGVTTGARVLEAGAGAGTVTAWLAERVGPTGHVLSTDIDLRFHLDMPAHVEMRQHDVEREPLPVDAFDVVHARALLQHLPGRETVLEKLVRALRPGGRLVIEDAVFAGFADQDLDEPYRTVHRLIAGAVGNEWHDPDFGLQLVDRFRRLGLTDITVDGGMWAMRPGEPAGEWWFLALERAIPRLVGAGLITNDDGATALAQVRAPGFVMLSPGHVAVTGTRPAV